MRDFEEREEVMWKSGKGNLLNFFGLPACHCWHFILWMQFLSGAGLAQNKGIGWSGNAVNAVPLCQCRPIPLPLETWIFQWQTKTTWEIFISNPWYFRSNVVPLKSQSLHYPLLATKLPILCHSMARAIHLRLDWHWTATLLPLTWHLIATWLSHDYHLTATRLFVTWLPLYYHFIVTWLPLN